MDEVRGSIPLGSTKDVLDPHCEAGSAMSANNPKADINA